MSWGFSAVGRFSKDVRCVLRHPEFLSAAMALVPSCRFPTPGAVNRFRPGSPASPLFRPHEDNRSVPPRRDRLNNSEGRSGIAGCGHVPSAVAASCSDLPSHLRRDHGIMKVSDRHVTAAASGTEQERPCNPGLRLNRAAKVAMRDSHPCNSKNCPKG